MSEIADFRPRDVARARVDGFEVLGYTFGLAVRHRGARRRMAELYERYAIPCVPPEAPVFSTQKRPRGDGYVWDVHLGDEFLGNADTPGQALALMEVEISNRIIAHRRDVIWIHAATVAGPRGAALIAGKSDAGKTTLALSLAALGHQVLGDDLAALEPRTLRTRPLSRCVKPDSRSRRLLRQVGLRLPRKRQGLITLGELWSGPARSPEVRLVFVLEPAADGTAPYSRPMLQAEAAGRLLPHIGQGDNAMGTVVETLGRLASRAGCYRLTRGRPAATARLVAGLLESL